MSRWELARSVTELVVTTLVQIVSVVWLESAGIIRGERAACGMLLSIVGVICYFRLLVLGVRVSARKPGGLRKLGELLQERNALAQVFACLALAVLVGNRFGFAGKESRAAWQRWWEHSWKQLQWNSDLLRFVEVDFAPEPK
jgi:hypothetical protein